MKKLLITVIFTIGSFQAIAAVSDVKQKLESLQLHEFYCDIYGYTQATKQETQTINFSSTQNVFAIDEAEAIKLCLLKVDAVTVGDHNGIKIMAHIPSLSRNAVNVKKIEIRNGQM